MFKKTSYLQALSFYAINDLGEIYSDQINPKKRDNKIKIATKIEEKNSSLDQKNQSSQSFFKSGFLDEKNTQPQKISTFEAINNIAQNNKMNESEKKFLPLNEIIATARSLANSAKTVAELKKIVENFDGCNLKKMATNTVFCDGNPASKIMIIGEAPGNHEDLEGIPFCGDSGILLSAMLDSIGLTRKNDYYITNVIFWRPPGNRRPTHEELEICRPFVERHIQLISPKVIILVGATAMSAILKNSDTISSIRGKFINFESDFLQQKTKIFTIFHPSFLMRQPLKKRVAWQDMTKLKKFIKNDYNE